MRIIDPLLVELEQEGATTRRVLERVPNDKLDWKPHGTSRSLGALAAHIGTALKAVSDAVQEKTHEARPTERPVPPDTLQILAQYDENLASAKAKLAKMSDADLMSPWSLTVGGAPKFTAPKIGIVRSIIMNHMIHHRGQLTVYLRQLGVPVPSVYGPSGDENPFM